MKWKEISVIAEHPCSEAIAELFLQLGSGGVVIEDPRLARDHIAKGDWDAYDLPRDFIEQEFTVVKAYFPEGQDVYNRLIEGIKNVESNFGVDCRCVIENADDEDWENCWKDHYHVTKVGKRLVIKPSWEDYQATEGEIVIEMDPGMAFGTGTHVTTRFCLELLERYIRGGEKVIDVGTGSGILAIAAAYLGASRVTGIDLDEASTRVARKNVACNHLEDRVKVLCLDFKGYQEKVGAADVLTANITAELVEAITPKVTRMLAKGGCFIASGIIASKWEMVRDTLDRNGLVLEEILQSQEEWIAIAARKGW